MKIQRNAEEVVQWNGSNLPEVKDFCKKYTEDIYIESGFLFIDGEEVKIGEVLYIETECCDEICAMSSDYLLKHYEVLNK